MGQGKIEKIHRTRAESNYSQSLRNALWELCSKWRGSRESVEGARVRDRQFLSRTKGTEYGETLDPAGLTIPSTWKVLPSPFPDQTYTLPPIVA